MENITVKVDLYDLLADAIICSRGNKAQIIVETLPNDKLIDLLIELAHMHGEGVATLTDVNDLVYDEVLKRMKGHKHMACKKGSCKKPTKKK